MLVNNAGVQFMGGCADQDLAAMQRELAVNLGAVLTGDAVIRLLTTDGGRRARSSPGTTVGNRHRGYHCGAGRRGRADFELRTFSGLCAITVESMTTRPIRTQEARHGRGTAPNSDTRAIFAD